MSKQNWQHAPIAVSFADGSTMAIVQWVTQGYGDTLPDGGAWLVPGCWIRPTNIPALVERKLAVLFADRAPVASWRFISPADVPADRTYRNALTDTGAAVVHDMPKARELHRAALRSERVERLVVLDSEWMRGTGQGIATEVANIEAERQALRDALSDPRIDLAQTTDELKAVTLDSAVQAASRR
jgi:hypothetical protein